MISGETNLLGVIGDPIKHSLSPLMHNAALKEMGLNWCYLALPCEANNLKVALEGLKVLNFKGLNITIPHKQAALGLCKSVTSIGTRIGAVNTLIPSDKNKMNWIGTNTDAEGFIAPLKSQKWTGSKALVLGCGGSARAVVAGLQDLKVKEIFIVGRDQKKLKTFIQDLNIYETKDKNKISLIEGILVTSLELIDHVKTSNLIVNTTPIGMNGNSLESNHGSKVPLGKELWQHLHSETTLYDLIYTPKQTDWLALGKLCNCELINGLEMLVEQGAASLRLWTGEERVPIDLMRSRLEKHLRL